MLQLEDYESFGIFGLLDAISKYDISMKASFSTYASLRIRGSIFDELRRFSPIKRRGNDKIAEYNKISEEAQQYYGHKCTVEELSAFTKRSVDDIKQLKEEIYSYRMPVSLDLLLFDTDINDINQTTFDIKDPNTKTGEDEILRQEVAKELEISLRSLTPKERQVIEMYYYEELSINEIAQICNFTESRASQLHRKALKKMKIALENYYNKYNSK